MSNSIFTVFRRALDQAIKSITRSRWTSVMTITALVLVFLLVHTMSAFISSAENIVRNLQNKVDIGVFFNEEADEHEIEIFLKALDDKKTKGDIKNYTYFSRDQELEEFEKKYPDRMVFLRRHNLGNPLLSMVEIIPARDKTDELTVFLFREEYSNVVNQKALRDSEDSRKRVKNFLTVASFAENSGGAVLLLFMIIATGLLFHAVGTAVKMHEQEIFIMRLVGANFWNIRLPYILEGLMIALSAFVISLLLGGIIFFIFSSIIENAFSDPEISQHISDFTSKLLTMFSVDVLRNASIILFLAFIGSFLAIEKHLRTQKIL